MLVQEEFFSLKGFAHASLWKKNEPIWFPLHALDTYLQNADLGQIEIKVPPNVTLVHPEKISIGKGTVLEPGVMIIGPCILGKDCHLRHGSFLRGGVICGDECKVGHNAEIKHSIVLNGAFLTHFVYVGDSIVGNFVNLGAGVKCANLRLDRKEIMIRHTNTKIATGLKKMGAIIGDQAQVGCNSVLNPGTLLSRGVICHPLLNFSGYAPPYSQIKKTQADWTVLPADPMALLPLLQGMER